MGYRKGFPIKLPLSHWVTVSQIHAWLQTHGLTTTAVDEAAALVPPLEPTPEEAAQAATGYLYGRFHWQNLSKPKTVRVRAANIKGLIILLRMVATFCSHGQVPGTLLRRADTLSEISELDLLADASR